jgi:beta-hydroxylase
MCPKTVELVQSIPSINAAMFTLLPPHSKLGAHRDPFAGSLRYHLGLATPNSDDCRIYIDGIPHSWRDGHDVLFDETYIHSAHNDTDEPRMILFCDVARPIRNPIMRGINRFVMHHIVKITQSQNVPTEHVGIVNRLIAPVFMIRDAGQNLKKKNKTAYRAVNFAIISGIVVGLVVLPFLWKK